MSYIGNTPTYGDTTGNFKILDDIASYTQTFDGSSASVVSLADDTLTFNSHRFITGQRVTYTHGGGTAIGGLTSGTVSTGGGGGSGGNNTPLFSAGGNGGSGIVIIAYPS